MAYWMVDYTLGNDANDGKSWATAFKTLNGVTTAKGFVSGDSVRVAQSPPPSSLGQTAQWTDQSKTVTLTTAVNATIDNCETAWTKGAASVIGTASTSQRQGTANANIFVSTTANTMQAYKAISPGDLSGYQQLSFWFWCGAAIADNTRLSLVLCSDAAGATPLYTFPVPAIPSNSSWVPITVDLQTPLSGSIQSVALWSGSSGLASAPQVQLDNIIACRASSDPTALTLQSLIGKSNGTDAFFAIQSIVGTSVSLDAQVSTTVASTKPYAGVTESVTTYKRETIKTVMATTSGATVQTPGVSASNSVFNCSGGWDTSSGLQTGETYFDGSNGYGYGIVAAASGALILQNISYVRYYGGYQASSAAPGSSVQGYQATNCTIGIANANYQPVTFTNLCCNTYGINGGQYSTYKIANANSNTNAAYSANLSGNVVQMVTCRNNVYGVSGTSGSTLNVIDSKFSNNSSYDIYLANVAYGTAYAKNCIYSTTIFPLNCDSRLISHNDQQVVGATKIWGDNFTIVNDSSVVHTAGGLSWKLSKGTGGSHTLQAYPVWLVIARVFCSANQSRTFSAWLRRDNINLTGQLAIRGNRVNGIPNDMTSNMTAAINTWQQIQLSVTPTEDAVIEVEAWCWGPATAANLWVADFSAT